MNSNSIWRIKKSAFDNVNVVGTFFVFLYVFSFYIVGPITSALLAGVIVVPVFLKPQAQKSLAKTAGSKYAVGLLSLNILLICLSTMYALLHQTNDFSYTKTLFAQAIHIICGIFVVAYLNYKYTIDLKTVTKLIVYAYLIQSLIEIVASSSPGLASFLLHFNRANDIQEYTQVIRGVALSSSTTWGLGLSYGIAFIIYVNRYMLDRLNFIVVAGWMLLVVGTSFAGRTGLVGAAISLIYFFIYSKIGLLKKASFITYILSVISILILLIFIVFPGYIELLVLKILPWAMEPLFNMIDGKGLTSASTDRLDEMWNTIPTLQQALLGTGHFTNPDGSFYMHVDVGILRNIFFWGIGGYISLLIYQLYTIYPLMTKNRGCFILSLFILLYLCVGEYKALTLGLNKLAFSNLFLLSFFCINKSPASNTTSY